MDPQNQQYTARNDKQKRPSSMEGIQPPAALLPDVLTRLGLSDVPVEYPLIALESGEWQERVRAIQALAELEAQAPLQHIVGHLDDEHEAVRMAALRALSKLFPHIPVPLVHFIEAWHDSHHHVRVTAIEVLGTLKPEAISTEMLLTALNDEDEEVRIAAIRLAETLGDRALVEQLAHALRNDPNWQVREAATYALGRLTQHEPSEVLIEALGDRSSSVRKAAAAALGEHLPMKRILEDLQYGETRVRERMARLLGELGEQTPVEVLERVVLEDEESSVRQAALLGLGQLEGRAHEKPLREAALQDRDENVREVAKLVLAALYPKDADKVERAQRRTSNLGERFGSYEIERVLREDEWAVVYLGRHIFNKTMALVRVLRTPVYGDREEQFRSQVVKIAQLEHSSIAQVLDFGIQKETGFLVTNCAGCENLRERYPEGNLIPLRTVVSYVKQVASTLQYAHDSGVVHQDIKPENMLLGDYEEILLDGFGISLLNPYETPGTMRYRAPEQIKIGYNISAATDQYSLAAIVYEWLCGERPPRLQNNNYETGRKGLSSLHERVPQIPEQVAAVISKALAASPEDRYGSIKEFADALEQVTLSRSHGKQPFSGEQETKGSFPKWTVRFVHRIFRHIMGAFMKLFGNRRH